MGLYWNPFGLLGILAFLGATAMAVLVFRARPYLATNRLLALVLVMEGVWSLGNVGLIYLLDSPSEVYAMQVVGGIGLFSLPGLYLAFLGRALPIPWTRPLRNPWILGILGISTAILLGLLVARPSVFYHYPTPQQYAAYDTGLAFAYDRILEGFALVLLFGAACALRYWITSPPNTPTRRQAGLYALAFVTRDLFLAALVFVYRPLSDVLRGASRFFSYFWLLEPPVVTLAFVALLGYAILRAQLFDIDLRLKWTLHRGTILAAFVTLFFVSVEAAQNFFSDTFGVAVGIGATALLLLALRPIQRLAQRMADAAMPGVHPSDAYVAFRKMEVYRTAYESALEGGISLKERRILEGLRQSLGLEQRDADSLERDAAASRRAPQRPARTSRHRQSI